jgi:dipeptidyl aminopeptidase/acylaminoacyl peptidase
MAEMKPVQYKARDGLLINGYLTLPLGKDPKNLPVIVNPHGGPWVRDVWGYNPEVQLLANRGYAVLQMNYRGSTGYGRQFWEASFKQWGKTMQDDITDSVQWLVKQGIADPKRVAIYGGSYGGYATLAGVAFTPDLYAAAVDYVGVSNMFTFMKTIPPYWKPFLDQMYEMVGDPVKDKELLTAVSPALHTDRIKTPLFVAQGANDPRVNKAESDQIVENLRKRGVPVEYMVKDNEGHGFHNEENRFDFYTAMEGFLSKHLTPQ